MSLRARLARRTLPALVLLASAVVPASAAAHAQLVSTQPAQHARVPGAPRQVAFRFSEAVTATLGAVRVYDARGKTVQAGDAFHPRGRGDSIAVRLPAHLADGGYTAVYRVISADSHPVSGGFSFTVGSGGAAARRPDALLEGTSAGPVTATALGVARGVQYAAIALAVGALLLSWLCWLPALRVAAGAGEGWQTTSDAYAAGVARLWLATGVVGVIASAVGILLEGAVGAGTSAWSVLDAGTVGDVLGTRFGRTWALGLLAWLLVAGLSRTPSLGRPPVLQRATVGATGLADRGRLAVVAVPLLGLCLLPAFGGHAATASPVAVMLPANVLHVLAISAWAGGVATLALLLRRSAQPLDEPDRPALLRAVMTRFSAFAGVAVAVVLASGIAQSLVNLSAFGQLIDTAYGRAVLIKLALFLVLLGFGVVQRRRVLPALGSGHRLGRVLLAEVAVMAAVFAVTGALATYPPGDARASTGPAGPVTRTGTVGPARATLTVTPAGTGPNDVVVSFVDRRTGQPWRLPEEVTVTAALPGAGIADLSVDLHGNGEGRYAGSGLALPVAGRWRITVAARVSDFDEYDAAFTAPIH